MPTRNAIIPSAVGVDIGCGMAAVRTSLTANDLPDDLGPLLGPIERAIPAGVGQGHSTTTHAGDQWFDANPYPGELAPKLATSARSQFGSLGSGNHFAEICLDENQRVWLFLHSGSRGIGNKLAHQHIATAKRMAGQLDHALDDPDLAWFVQGTPEFEAYVADMLWRRAAELGIVGDRRYFDMSSIDDIFTKVDEMLSNEYIQ